MSNHSEKTILLTGAGASKPLGYATTEEFFNSEISGASWSPKQDNIHATLVNILGDGSKDVENILRLIQPAEEFLKSPSGEFLRRIIQNNGHGDSYSGPIGAFAKQVRERCFDIYGAEPDDERVADLFSPLLEILKWKKLPVDIFTLNYDLVLDSLLEFASRSGVTAYDGFTANRSKFDTAGYCDPDVMLRLYRLHGSLSWVRVGSAIINQRHCARTSVPHIYIPPGFKGDPNVKDHGGPIVRAHEDFDTALKKAARCIVIGYSFRDPHINKKFESAFHLNGQLKVLVVDPSTPRSPESGFSELHRKNKDRFLHIQERFGSQTAISEIAKFL